MITKFSLRHAAILATLLAGAVIVTDVAQAASSTPAGTRRTISTVGLTQYNLGGGVTVYTNSASSISSFRWNTGATSGQVSTVGGAQ